MTLRPRQTIYRRGTPGMEPVPAQWTPVQMTRYPSDNSHTFERWYLDTFGSSFARGRVYLPVQWTAIYCNNGYGANKSVIRTLQHYLDKLDPKVPYYTIVQYDDGILNSLDHLDIKVFSMGGGRVDYPIPLLCMPHQLHPVNKQDIFASFIGKLTHEYRRAVLALEGTPGWYVSGKHHSLTQYTEYMQRSLYSLAPRGYGVNSFRVCEAILAGSVPVYISDVHHIPYNIPFDYGVLLQPGEDIVAALQNVTGLRPLREVRELYTYQGCREWMLKTLKDEK